LKTRAGPARGGRGRASADNAAPATDRRAKVPRERMPFTAARLGIFLPLQAAFVQNICRHFIENMLTL
jgi:hypothetical protein